MALIMSSPARSLLVQETELERSRLFLWDPGGESSRLVDR